MATISTVGAFSRAQVQTDSNGLTDTNLVIFANEALLDFRRRLIDAGVDASQLQEAYMSFTANTGTYLYPTDMFWLKTIELNYVNTNDQDYKQAQQVDISNTPGQSSFSWLRKQGDRMQPQFDDRGDWFETFPTPTGSDNLSQAIRIFYFLEPTEYATTSDTISYPESLDYRILGWRICEDYLRSLEKHDSADRFQMKYDERVKQVIETLSRGAQQPIQATDIQLSGFEF